MKTRINIAHFMKLIVGSITLVMLMCWALQSSAQPMRASERKVGVCEVIPNMENQESSLESSLSPLATAANYLWEYEFKANQKTESEKNVIRNRIAEMERNASIELVKGPQFGTLKNEADLMTLDGKPGYLGKDNVVIIVNVGGYKLTLNYFIKYINSPLGNEQEGESTLCNGRSFSIWKISTNSEGAHLSASLRELKLHD